MKFLIPAFILVLPVTLLSSCGDSDDQPPPLVGTPRASAAPAQAAFQKALTADQAGKKKKAIKLYRSMADDYPNANDTAQARVRQGQLLEEKGDLMEAFQAYNEVVNRHQGSKLYAQALDREKAIAQQAMDGKVKSGFLFSSKVDTSKMVELLEKVRDGAPQATSAPKAQFQIGEVYQNRGKANESIAAYRRVVSDWPDSPQAPEAQYRVGVILIEQAKRGNQDRGNLDRAREVFQDYLMIYPNGARAKEAREQVASLSYQDIERSLDVANFYKRKGDLESARFYYKEVISKQKSGPLHDKAQQGLKSIP
jgi:outer membrane protein assembly factor BamD